MQFGTFILDLLQALHHFYRYANGKDKIRTELLTLGNEGQFACAVFELFKGFFLFICEDGVQFFLPLKHQYIQ